MVSNKNYLVAMLVILLLGAFIVNKPYFNEFIYIIPKAIAYEDNTTSADRFDWRTYYEDYTSFLEKNLDIEDKDSVLLMGKNDKPYYLYDMNLYKPANSLRLFNKFTAGDGTREFAEAHKEIKAVVFYQSDYDKLKNIKRKVKKVIFQDNRYKVSVGRCRINNGVCRLQTTSSKSKLWKFIPSESTAVSRYGIVKPNDYNDTVQYFESQEITPSFTSDYYFSIRNMVINPNLPFIITVDIKSNYCGPAVAAVVGVYSSDGITLLRKVSIGGGINPERGVWVKQSSDDLSARLRKMFSKDNANYLFKLERIFISVSISQKPVGIMLLDD